MGEEWAEIEKREGLGGYLVLQNHCSDSDMATPHPDPVTSPTLRLPGFGVLTELTA